MVAHWHNGSATLANSQLGGNRLIIRWPILQVVKPVSTQLAVGEQTLAPPLPISLERAVNKCIISVVNFSVDSQDRGTLIGRAKSHRLLNITEK